ncbi:DUF6332 family protein [Streptomyces pratensis]|uniref:DUF6332 family protein n=1 Tax=Streptomyces pratensis TaxID=1169025 RepID=UPI00301890C7
MRRGGAAGPPGPVPRPAGRRTRAEQDAMTIEIGYALVSAAFLAALTFAGVLAPWLFFFDLGPTARRVVLGVATTTAVLAFAARVAHVLWRFPQREAAPLPTPSPPGRPDA